MDDKDVDWKTRGRVDKYGNVHPRIGHDGPEGLEV
jgi:hypothetical protein